jgi:hypothetical protein
MMLALNDTKRPGLPSARILANGITHQASIINIQINILHKIE